MGSQIEQVCGRCGNKHTFFYADADSFNARSSYEAICPETNERWQFMTDDWGLVTQSPPRDAIEVRKV